MVFFSAFSVLLCDLAVAQETAVEDASRHTWFNARHLWQVLSHVSDTRHIQRAFKQADRVVPAGDPGARGREVEHEAVRRLPRDPGLLTNVEIVEVGGRRYVSQIGRERVSFADSRVIAEADVLRLKPGRTLTVGEPFDRGVVRQAWDYKLPDHPMKGKQRARYRDAFGVEPIEVHPTSTSRALANVARTEAAAMGQFAAAWLLKEAFKAVETGDPSRVKEAALQLREPGFWGSLAAFSVAARAAEFALAKLPVAGLGRTALPLAAGMAAVQLLTGQGDWKDVLIDTVAYLAVGLTVNAIADGLVYPVLFAAGPPGWIAAGAYTIAKLAVTLYAGEKLGAWLRRRLAGRRAPSPGGIRSRIDTIDTGLEGTHQ